MLYIIIFFKKILILIKNNNYLININKMSNEEGDTTEKDKIDYEILREDYPNYDLSFKVIVIGNSSN
jgi:hypothetical protein